MATKTLKPQDVKMPLKLRFKRRKQVPKEDIEKAVKEVQNEIQQDEGADVRQYKEES